jgi:outer membrane protein
MKPLVTAIFLAFSVQGVLAEDLLDVYALAEKNDPQLAAALASLEAARMNTPIARSQLLPQVNANGGLNWQDVEGERSLSGGGSASLDDSYWSRRLGLGLVQPIYRRDRLKQLEQAKTTVEQAESQYTAIEQNLIFRVASAYFQVLSAQDTLEFAQSELKAIARQLDQAKQRFEVGLIAITGVHEAQARFDQSRADVISAENDVGTAWEALREIIGQMGPNELATLEAEIPLRVPEPAGMDAWSAMALDNNPSVQAAREAAEIARQEIEIQRSGHYPTLDFVANYDMSRSDSDTGSDTDVLAAGVQLAVPIYTGGGVTASTQQARFNFEAAQKELESQLRATDKAVRDAYRQAELSISRVQALQSTTVSAESALEATEAGFEVGTRTLVDVLNRQSELFSAKRDYANARYLYVLNYLALKQAAGSLTVEDLELVNEWLK